MPTELETLNDTILDQAELIAYLQDELSSWKYKVDNLKMHIGYLIAARDNVIGDYSEDRDIQGDE